MESISIANKILQNAIRFYWILDKNPMESIAIASKILEDPTRFYGIQNKQAMESISIANKILQDTRQKCYGTHINTKQLPQDSTGY